MKRICPILTSRNIFLVSTIFIVINLLLIHFERKNFSTTAKVTLNRFEQFHTLADLNLGYIYSSNDKFVQSLLPNKKTAMVNAVTIDTFHECSIYHKNMNGNESTFSQKISQEQYDQIKTSEKFNIWVLCRALSNLINIKEHINLIKENELILVEVPRPSLLISDINNNADNTIIDDLANNKQSWVIIPNAIPSARLSSEPLHSIAMSPKNFSFTMYKPHLFLRMDIFKDNSSLFFGKITNLFDLSPLENKANFAQFALAIEQASINPIVKWRTYSIAQPIILILSICILFVLSLITKTLISIHRFFSVASLSSYGLIKVSSSGNRISVVKSNTLSNLNIKDFEYELLNETLKPSASFYEASYINLKNEEAITCYRIVANTMTRNNLNGFVLLWDATDVQKQLSSYEATYKMDALTKLPNRVELDHFIKENKGSTTRKFLMCLIDLDRFKAFNDEFGHQFGDLVLKHAAEHLRSSISFKKNDRLIRVGGEEFLLLMELEENKYPEALKSIASRVLAFNQGNLSFSGGIVLWQPKKQLFDDAYKVADELLYAAKNSGRKQIHAELCDSKVLKLNAKGVIEESVNIATVKHLNTQN